MSKPVENVEEMYCHRCGWSGKWHEAKFEQCADGCCDIDVCPRCRLELSNYPKDNEQT